MWKTSSFCGESQCIEVGTWEKSSSSYSNGNCVEVGGFRTSNFCVNAGCVEAGAWNVAQVCDANACVETGAVTSSCSNGSCVEAEHTEHVVAVRDTKDSTIPPVVFSLDAWQAFIGDVKAGKYPLTDADDYRIGHLVFDRSEWDAFVKGAQHLDENGRGEFDLSPELEAELAGAV